jgi:hypothetical protein
LKWAKATISRVTLDSCLSFRRHLEDVTARAIRRMGALSRLMPRTSGSERGKKKAFVCGRSVDGVVRIEGVGRCPKS